VAQADVACLYKGMRNTYQRIREQISKQMLLDVIDTLEKKILNLQSVTGDSYGNELNFNQEKSRKMDLITAKAKLQQYKSDLKRLP
jgi:2-phospho-L-lactate guanylyltransferase (CobY/MobA/RfbA family)